MRVEVVMADSRAAGRELVMMLYYYYQHNPARQT
jgi:hypothetical protein